MYCISKGGFVNYSVSVMKEYRALNTIQLIGEFNTRLVSWTRVHSMALLIPHLSKYYINQLTLLGIIFLTVL